MRLLPVKVLNNLVIQLGEDSDCVHVTLHKTVRIPEDGKKYPLPPSLGMFTVYEIDDFRDKVPDSWLLGGGVFICLHQSQALWIQFQTAGELNNNRPKAVKIGVGNVNVIDGSTWGVGLQKDSNDYCVLPDQDWIDGIVTSEGTTKQFVAQPLGEGYTVEKQLTGNETIGGIQMIMYNCHEEYKTPKSEDTKFEIDIPDFSTFELRLPEINISSQEQSITTSQITSSGYNGTNSGKIMMRGGSITSQIIQSIDNDNDDGQKEMGISVGGNIKQKVYKDSYGYEVWDQKRYAKLEIHIVNTKMFEKITGQSPPKNEITARVYSEFGFPWFDVYDEKRVGISGSEILKNVKSVKEIQKERNCDLVDEEESIEINNVLTIGRKEVLDGN